MRVPICQSHLSPESFMRFEGSTIAARNWNADGTVVPRTGAQIANVFEEGGRVPGATQAIAIETLRAAGRGSRVEWNDAERAAMELLYGSYGKTALRVARRVMGSRSGAEDVVQEVFLRLPVYLSRYRPGNFESWLKRVVWRRALTQRRRETRSGLVPIDVAAETMEHELAGSESIARLRWMVGALPAALRLVVQLRVEQGLSHEQIGRQLEITAAASAVRYWRAIQQLRKLTTSRPIDEVIHV